MELDIFRKLKKKISKDLIIDKDTVLNQSLNRVKLQTTYNDIFSTEFRNLRNKIANLDKKYGELYHHFKFNSKYNLTSKTDIEAYIKKDELYYTLLKEVNDQKMIVEFLENTVKNIKTMSYDIKNFIEYKKFLEGNN